MQALEKATADDAINIFQKCEILEILNRLVSLSQKLKEEKNISHTPYELTKLPGIRKNI
jgi:hypothetical protein